MKLPDSPRKYTIPLLGASTDIFIITQGAARLNYGTVSGLSLARVVTLGELIRGRCIAIGYIVQYLILFHFLVIVSGKFLINIPLGWFTIGQNTGLVEFSLLLLFVLVNISNKSAESDYQLIS